MLIAEGVEYFNPDQAAELIRVANPGITLEESQSAAWDEGRRLLEGRSTNVLTTLLRPPWRKNDPSAVLALSKLTVISLAC